MLASPAMRRRLRAVTLLAFPFVLALPATPARATSGEADREVEMIDNVFGPSVVRVPVGGTVRWTNDGRGLHNVTADDGSFASPDLEPGEFIHTLGDAHLYDNHLEQARLQLTREPRPLPTMHIDASIQSIFDFQFEHFRLENYQPHPHIAAPIAV